MTGDSFLLTLPAARPVIVADLPLFPVEAVSGFRKTGVACERCGHECRGLDRLRPGVYCARENCRAWWTQGPLPNQGQRQPANEIIGFHWRVTNGHA